MGIERQPEKAPVSKKILLAEHDESCRQLLVVAARKEGFDVETACTGDEAILKIKRSRPDLVMLDMMLPDAGSYEVLRDLQEAGKPGVPIISLIDADFDVNISDILRREPNVVECLRKPIPDAVFARTVRGILDTRGRS